MIPVIKEILSDPKINNTCLLSEKHKKNSILTDYYIILERIVTLWKWIHKMNPKIAHT
jgi:hypothetical protein